MSVEGTLHLESRSQWRLTMRCTRDVRIGSECEFQGDLFAAGDVAVGADTRVVGALRAGGKLDWSDGATATGPVEAGTLVLNGRTSVRKVHLANGIGSTTEPVGTLTIATTERVL